jgi:ParB-like chromosome segregation protein Spo0J
MNNIIEPLQSLAVPLDSVEPDPRNARAHPDSNMEAIKLSYREYGQRKPIIVNKTTGYIEAGNGQWQAAKALGWDKIAAVFVEDDEQRASAFALMDNRSAEMAEWDWPVLKDLLGDLDTGDFDMDLTGFDEAHVESIMTWTPPEQTEGPETPGVGESHIVHQCPECGHKFTGGQVKE